MLRTMRLTLAAFVALTLLTGTVAAKVPADAWQAGTLTDSSETWHSRTVGTLNSNHGMLIGREYPIITYTIEADTFTYEVELTLRHRGDDRPSLTVNGPIKFAIVKSDFFIKDEQGKEFRLILAKKTIKLQPAEPK